MRVKSVLIIALMVVGGLVLGLGLSSLMRMVHLREAIGLGKNIANGIPWATGGILFGWLIGKFGVPGKH